MAIRCMRISKNVFFPLALLLAATLTGCTSFFKRQECEGTNWYAYGQKVALSGRRLSGDGFVGECRRVEAKIQESELDKGFKQGMSKYCEPGQAFLTGKSGETFSTEMCDGENLRVLVDKHSAGVSEYCQKGNGYTAGAKGKPYNGICPKQFESVFLPEFKRGRRGFLAVLLSENEKKIRDLDWEISGLESRRAMKVSEADQLLSPQLIIERVYEPESGTYRDDHQFRVSAEHQAQADNLRFEAQRIDGEISDKQREQSKLRDQNREIRLEVVSLANPGEG